MTMVSPKPPSLHLVPQAEPSPKQAVIERVKAMPRPEGLLQCPRCGNRGMITQIIGGAFVKNGRRQGGTEIEKDICSECFKRGIRTTMLTDIKRIE